MNITSDRTYMIFRKENEHGTFYTIGLSKKTTDGKYVNGYKEIRFRKDKDVPDKSIIKIKQAWIDFYLKNDITKDYIFINDFEILKQEK